MTKLATHFERDFLSGGRVVHTQHLKPIAYADASGRIRPIVRDWQDSQIPGTNHMQMQGPFGVSVSNGGEIRYHPTWEAGAGFQIGDPIYRLDGDIKHFDLGTPERSANRLEWLTQHLRMRYTHLGHAGKLAMLFRTDAYQHIDDRQIAFPITYAGCQRQGRYITIDGRRVMRLRPFRAYDLDTPEEPIPVPHELRTTGGKEYIILTLPLAMDAWSNPVLDPTFETQPAAAAGTDTFCDQNNANQNYDTNAGWLASGRYSEVAKFDLSSIPSGATVSAATLYLTQYLCDKDATFTMYRILSANSAWTESGACYNYQTGSTDWAGGNTGCKTSGTDHASTALYSGDPGKATEEKAHSLDLDEFALMRANNYGFVHYGGSVAEYRFSRSSDYSTAGDRPRLVVEYTLSPSSHGPAMLRRQRH